MPSTNRILLINYLKGFAIFTIALMHLLMNCHFKDSLGKAIMLGGGGVHVFILCSGFGLYYSYLHKPLSYATFLRRRFLKVYFPYFFAIFLWALWILFSTSSFPLTAISSHIFLWKMFSPHYDSSICSHYWFISAIIQFYLAWPVIVKLMSLKHGFIISVIISLTWSLFVGFIGAEGLRPLGSCFLQYLWEFCLGILLARKCHEMQSTNGIFPKWIYANNIKWHWCIIGVPVGWGLMGLMTKVGGALKWFNDYPSLLGYLSCAILVYKIGRVCAERLFCWINGFSYELYLIHSLVYSIVLFFTQDFIPLYISLPLAFLGAFAVAYAYSSLLKIAKIK